MRISITAKLIIFVLILSLIATYAIGKYSYEKAKEALVQRTYDQLTSLRIEKANRIVNFFDQCKNDIDNIIRVNDTKELIFKSALTKEHENDSFDQRQVQAIYNQYLKGYVEARKSYSRIILMNKDKALVIDVNGQNVDQNCLMEKPLNRRLKKMYELAMKDNMMVFRDIGGVDDAENPILYLTTRMGDFEETNEIVALLEIPFDNINEIMFENNQNYGFGKSGETYLVGSDYLMRSSSRFQDNSVFKTKVNTTAVRKAFNGLTNTARIEDYRNIPVFSSFGLIKESNLEWAILAEIDTEEAMVQIYSLKSNIMYLTFIIFLLLLGVVALFTSMVTAPVRALIHKTNRVAMGEYGVKLDYSANDEVGDLVYAFNQMTSKLKTQAENLEKERILRLTSLIDGQELERQRLSKELHDGLGQLILASKLKFERALELKPEKARQIIEETEELFKKTMQEVRNISNGLMPAVLTQFGLEVAIHNLTRELSESTGIKMRANISIKKQNIGHKLETYLYRIVQESINNVIKHSNAREVEVVLLENEGDLFLSVKDDGIGIPDNVTLGGNGLNNMKDRATLLGGEFEIISEEGRGTEVRLSIKNFNHGID